METYLFNAGSIIMTPAILRQCADDLTFDRFCLNCFGRHMRGDWGDMDEEDMSLNDEALATGIGSLMSVYIYDKTDKTIWIITEDDRSATTILFPEER